MRYWIGIASADHVRTGRNEGFMQLCHGKSGPLKRIQPGDGIVYYSPSLAYGARDGYQSLTAIGHIRKGDPYLVDMSTTFQPWRRDVDWADATEVGIRPLLDDLTFTAGKASWGYAFRFGILEMTAFDFRLVAKAMKADFKAVAA